MFWLRFLSSTASESRRGSLAQRGAGVSIETAPTLEAGPAPARARASWDGDGRTARDSSPLPSAPRACLKSSSARQSFQREAEGGRRARQEKKNKTEEKNAELRSTGLGRLLLLFHHSRSVSQPAGRVHSAPRPTERHHWGSSCSCAAVCAGARARSQMRVRHLIPR